MSALTANAPDPKKADEDTTGYEVEKTVADVEDDDDDDEAEAVADGADGEKKKKKKKKVSIMEAHCAPQLSPYSRTDAALYSGLTSSTRSIIIEFTSRYAYYAFRSFLVLFFVDKRFDEGRRRQYLRMYTSALAYFISLMGRACCLMRSWASTRRSCCSRPFTLKA